MPDRLQKLKSLNERRMTLALRAMAWEQLIALSRGQDVKTFIDAGLYRETVNAWADAETEFIRCLRQCEKEVLEVVVGEKDE